MKNKNSWFKDWDEGNFNLDDKTLGNLHPINKNKKETHHFSYLKNIETKEENLFNKCYPIIAFILVTSMIVFFLYAVSKMPEFGSVSTPANSSEVIRRYIEDGLKETGAVNIVAGVILDYRAFDTLGESHVLFTAAVVVTALMLINKEEKEQEKIKDIMEKDNILKTTSKILVPFVIVFGIYVVLCGHLGPGGGFSGGSIIGAALILYSIANGKDALQKIITPKRYKITVLCAFGFYSISKCYSFYCGANHLETIFTTGTPGAILSAGLILPLNIAVGIVVALTMYGFWCYFTRRHL